MNQNPLIKTRKRGLAAPFHTIPLSAKVLVCISSFFIFNYLLQLVVTIIFLFEYLCFT